MSSASSAARELLAAYVAGKIPASRLVPAIAAEYYRSPHRNTREALRPVMDVIERAAPGIVRLARNESGIGGVGGGGPGGFDVQLAERPFPETFETPLREAAAGVLAGAWRDAGGEAPPAAPLSKALPAQEVVGFWARVLARVRRLFSASA